jgi:hypothetical protein
LSAGIYCRVKLLSTDVSKVRGASIIPDQAARTSETSVDNYFTRQYIPEDNSELQDYLWIVIYASEQDMVLAVARDECNAKHVFWV